MSKTVVMSELGNLYAALWIATRRYNYGRCELARVGDELQVVGTDAYVLVCAKVGAVAFDGWQDGDYVNISDIMGLRAMRRMCDKGAGGVARPMSVTVDDGCVEVRRTSPADSIVEQVMRFTDTDPRRLNLEKFDGIEVIGKPVSCWMTTSNWKAIGKLVGIVCPSSTWRMSFLGEGAPWRLDEHNGRAYILAMPLKG